MVLNRGWIDGRNTDLFSSPPFFLSSYLFSRVFCGIICEADKDDPERSVFFLFSSLSTFRSTPLSHRTWRSYPLSPPPFLGPSYSLPLCRTALKEEGNNNGKTNSPSLFLFSPLPLSVPALLTFSSANRGTEGELFLFPPFSPPLLPVSPFRTFF